MALKTEREDLHDRLGRLDAQQKAMGDIDGLVEDALSSIHEFEDVFQEGTLEERKGFVHLFV